MYNKGDSLFLSVTHERVVAGAATAAGAMSGLAAGVTDGEMSGLGSEVTAAKDVEVLSALIIYIHASAV